MSEDDGASPFKFPIKKTAMGELSVKRRERKMWGPDADCQHHSMVIDEELRIILCGSCGEQLDPITCLMRWARIEYHLDSRVSEIARFKKEQAEKNAGKRFRCRECGKLFPILEMSERWAHCQGCEMDGRSKNKGGNVERRPDIPSPSRRLPDNSA